MSNRPEAGPAALVLFSVTPLVAHSNTGIISGRVTDPTSAVVPKAQITLNQFETNVDSVSVTNSDGLFRVPSLLSLTLTR